MHIPHRVQQRRHLALAGPDHSGIRVPGCRDSERRRQIEITPPFGVPDVRTFGPLPDDRPSAVAGDERHIARLKSAKLLEDGGGARHGSWPGQTPRMSAGQITLCIWT